MESLPPRSTQGISSDESKDSCPPRILAAITSLFLVFTGALAAVMFAAPAQADPYQAQAGTTCSIDAPSVVKVGANIRVRMDVTSSGTLPVTGTVKMIFRTLNGRVFSEETADYNGKPITLTAGDFPNVGDYERVMTFTPSGTTLRSCSATGAFRVASDTSVSSPPTNNPSPPNGGIDQNGVLPETGGPALLWLVFLLGGGGVIAYSRRDPGSAYRS